MKGACTANKIQIYKLIAMGIKTKTYIIISLQNSNNQLKRIILKVNDLYINKLKSKIK